MMTVNEELLREQLRLTREILEEKIDSSAGERGQQIQGVVDRLSRVEGKIDLVNGTVREHGEALSRQERDMQIVSRSFERLPCVKDPDYSGRLKEQVHRFGVNWGIVWNISQALLLGVIAAKLSGVF